MNVVQPADGLRLALEARHRRLRLRDRLMQELERDLLAEIDALGAVHDAHAAGAQLIEHLPATIDDRTDQRIAFLASLLHLRPVVSIAAISPATSHC